MGLGEGERDFSRTFPTTFLTFPFSSSTSFLILERPCRGRGEGDLERERDREVDILRTLSSTFLISFLTFSSTLCSPLRTFERDRSGCTAGGGEGEREGVSDLARREDRFLTGGGGEGDLDEATGEAEDGFERVERGSGAGEGEREGLAEGSGFFSDRRLLPRSCSASAMGEGLEEGDCSLGLRWRGGEGEREVD